MMDYNLGQSLLVAPDVSFPRIQTALGKLGFRQEREPSRPLLAGEPEFASFSWGGRKPFVLYSFNPVARLRVLDVATVPPPLRGAIAAALPLLDDFAVNDLLFDPDPRRRLLGLWAMQETERLDLIPQTQRLRHDRERLVADQANAIGQRLQRILQAREELMINMHLLVEACEPLVRELNDPMLTPSLKPTQAELTQLFDPELAAPLKRALDRSYQMPPLAEPGGEYPHLRITAANAGLLRWPNELSEKFPRGYRNIAGWMNPKQIWFSWRWTAQEDAPPGAPGVQFDGLVWLDRRWIWLPKVFRLVAPILDAMSVTAPGSDLPVH